MRELPEVIRAGAELHRQTMDLDKLKLTLSRADLEGQVNAVFRAFLEQAGIDLQVRVQFGDVHALMGRVWHTELAFVEFDGPRCTLHFHDRLIAFKDPNAGFIFVAKSWVLLPILAELLVRDPQCTGRFVFEIGDNGGMDSVAFCSNHPDACLIPDYEFMTTHGYAKVRAAFKRTSLPWEERQNRVFWRGSTTGKRLAEPPPEGRPDDFAWLQRLRLCMAARDPAIAAHCDVGITAIVQIPEPLLVSRIQKAGLIRPSVTREHFAGFKYVFDIDGNSNSWSGLFCSLLGGSCVIKVGSPLGYRQWYYDQLEPWTNFVPVSSDLSDLPTSLLRATRDDNRSRELAANGRSLAHDITLQAALDAAAHSIRRWLKQRQET